MAMDKIVMVRMDKELKAKLIKLSNRLDMKEGEYLRFLLEKAR